VDKPKLEIVEEPTDDEVIEALEPGIDEEIQVIPCNIMGVVAPRFLSEDDCGPRTRLDDVLALTLATSQGVNSYTLTPDQVINAARFFLRCHQRMYVKPTIDVVGGNLVTP
jgi:hypothetical protein